MPAVRRDRRSRLAAITLPFFRSEARWPAVGLLVLLLAFILMLVGLNAWSGYSNRDFMTAVWGREAGAALRYALLWAGVLAILTATAVFKAFTEERLRLRWRAWLTAHLIDRYLTRRAFFRLKAHAEVDNPDQRITEDVKLFTDHALALLLIFVNSTITLVLFSGILWSITPWLFFAAVLYAAFGTGMTLLLGSRLVRYDLIQVRTHAEPIALLAGEQEERSRLNRLLDKVVANMRQIIALSRNINFFTFGYDNIGQLLPLLITGVLFIRGTITEFGEITQAQMMFLHVIGAFSLIVKEFQRVSAFRAVVERLAGFLDALDEAPADPKLSLIEVAEDPSRVAFENVTLRRPEDGRALVRDLSAEAPRGKTLLLLGPRSPGQEAVLRAAAGLWTCGEGRVVRPPPGRVVFLPQRPHLRAGSLRQQLLYATGKEGHDDEALLAALRAVGLGELITHVGGLDAEYDWPNTLSLGEQQQLAFARLLLAHPPFAVLDEAASGLQPAQALALYDALSETGITYVTVSSDSSLARYHDLVVELEPDGAQASASGALLGIPA